MIQENTSLSLSNQETEIIDASKIREMTLDFTKQVDELDKAIQLTKDAGALAIAVQQKGVFGSFVGSFSGSNDKELAESVKILGASVETTQRIIEVILKVNNVKNQYLKSFHSALTDKILTLSKEMDVSYGNQKNAKQATITIATQLRAQIEEKINHSEMIEEHEAEISQLQEYTKSKAKMDEEQSTAIIEFKEKALVKDHLDRQQSDDIKSIKANITQNDTVDQEQTLDINTLKVISQNKDKLDNQQSSDIGILKENFIKLNSINEKQSLEIQILKEKDVQKDQHNEKQYQEINVLLDKIEMLQNVVVQTTDNFNKYVTKNNSFSNALKTFALPLMSFLIATTALYLTLR